MIIVKKFTKRMIIQLIFFNKLRIIQREVQINKQDKKKPQKKQTMTLNQLIEQKQGQTEEIQRSIKILKSQIRNYLLVLNYFVYAMGMVLTGITSQLLFARNYQEEYLRKSLKKLDRLQNLQAELYLTLQKTNDDLLNSQINTQLSGSTVVAIFIHEQTIYSFNVGDSRAILLNCQFQNWKAQSLTNDHKPTRVDEGKRIIAAGGRLQYQTNEKGENIGPLRVWMKKIKSPGLAMTRSFGDKAGMRAGTIAEPEINQYNIDEKNKYLLVASDGVWQHIQNHEIVKILSKTLKEEKIEEIADKLMESVCRIWDEKCISRDDVTFILVKIDREKREEK